jgi:hypothetical protein
LLSKKQAYFTKHQWLKPAQRNPPYPLRLKPGGLRRVNQVSYKDINLLLPSKPDDCALDIYQVDQSVQYPTSVVGEIRLGGGMFPCFFESELLDSAKRKACEAGADAIQIVQSYPGYSLSDQHCIRMDARFLKYGQAPGVAQVNTYSDVGQASPEKPRPTDTPEQDKNNQVTIRPLAPQVAGATPVRWAVVIGVSAYADTRIPSLRRARLLVFAVYFSNSLLD